MRHQVGGKPGLSSDALLLFLVQAPLLENRGQNVCNQDLNENIHTNSSAPVLSPPQVFAFQDAVERLEVISRRNYAFQFAPEQRSRDLSAVIRPTFPEVVSRPIVSEIVDVFERLTNRLSGAELGKVPLRCQQLAGLLNDLCFHQGVF